MADQTHIWICVYGLLALLLVLGALVGRRFRTAPNDNPRLRYARLRAAFIGYGMLCALQAFAAFKGHETVLWKKYLVSVLMVLCCGMFGFQSWRARKKWLASSEFKSLPPKKLLPLFFGQAV